MKKTTFFLCSGIAAFLLLSSSFSSVAQVAPADTGASKVIIIENNDNTTASRPGQRKSTPSYNNLIRWNMFELAKGVIGFGYERRLSDVFSADFVLGYTMRDYIGNIFDEEDLSNNTSGNIDYADNKYKVHGGVAFMLGTRIYPGGNDDFDGFYLAPHLYFKNYSYDRTVNYELWNGSSTYSTYTNTSQVVPITQKVTDLGIRFGWQRETGMDGFFYDFNIGFGTRKTTYDQIVSIDVPNGNGGTYISGVTTTSQESSTFAMLLGFNIGFAF
jgi:hypothetical protein